MVQTLQAIQSAAQAVVADIVTFLPQLVAALVILVFGWLVGMAVGWVVKSVVGRTGVDRYARDSVISDLFGRTHQPLAWFLSGIAKWFVYGLTLLTAADVLAIPFLTEWISLALVYLPVFFGGLLVILIGIIVADVIGDLIERTEAATRTPYTVYIADTVRIFLYFTVIVMGLETMGINVGILYIFVGALAAGLALALALGAGIAFGLGGKEYVSEHIDEWVQREEEAQG